MVLLLNATVLHHRAGLPDEGRTVAAVGGEHLILGRLLVAAAALTIFLGTVVTGSGPHAGSRDGELVERLPFDVGAVARLHSVAVLLFGALALYLLRCLRLAGVPAQVSRRGQVLLGVLVAQAAVGYAQYFTAVPPLLVAIHILGAVAVWIATLRLVLSMRMRMDTEQPPADDPATYDAAPLRA
jgi:cytochrome c oxidase assembly protein subunit 15